jgi:hypothetical protein
MTALLYPHEREAIATQIKADIDAYTAKAYNDGHRNHLGASLIGDACNRRLWYSWRWVKFPNFSGRMQRLFNRGHKEEARFIEWLRAIGFTIWEGTEDGKQFRISAVQGHFGGSLDGIGVAPGRPEYYKLYAIGPLLTEYKTHGDKSFKELVKLGVRKAKPKHFAQMSTYGRKYGYKYALYMAINKNDDDLHVEIVELDWNIGADLERKAEEVITSLAPPRRISEYSTHMECKFCDFADICHKGAPYEVNCRSCAFAVPIENGQWHCGGWKTTLTLDTIKVGCPHWKPIGRNN